MDGRALGVADAVFEKWGNTLGSENLETFSNLPRLGAIRVVSDRVFNLRPVAGNYDAVHACFAWAKH
jgi:hypothetical protein